MNTRAGPENAAQRKIGRKHALNPTGLEKRPETERINNRLFAVFSMSHNVYFTTYKYLKPVITQVDPSHYKHRTKRPIAEHFAPATDTRNSVSQNKNFSILISLHDRITKNSLGGSFGLKPN